MRNLLSACTARVALGSVLSLLLLGGLPAWAEHPDTSSEIENLKRRIEVLEAERAEEQPFSLFGPGRRLTFSGLLELEASYVNTEGGDDESDLSLATAQLEVSAAMNDSVAGYIVFLHEEDAEDSIEIDEALMVLTCPVEMFGGSLSLTGGKLYVPFGRFESHFMTDPLGLDLGETNDTAVYLGWEIAERIAIKAGVFNGEADTAGDNDHIDSFVASVEVQPLPELFLGASYISDLAESDIELVREDETLGNVYRSSVPAVDVNLTLAVGNFTLEAEYLMATETFSRAVVEAAAAEEGDLTGRRPRAWNLELAYIPAERWELAVRGEQAKDFQDDMRRYGAIVSYGLMENVVIGLEYLHADGQGEDNDPSHALTGQLAFEF